MRGRFPLDRHGYTIYSLVESHNSTDRPFHNKVYLLCLQWHISLKRYHSANELHDIYTRYSNAEDSYFINVQLLVRFSLNERYGTYVG